MLRNLTSLCSSCHRRAHGRSVGLWGILRWAVGAACRLIGALVLLIIILLIARLVGV